jgi:hypothetical protein
MTPEEIQERNAEISIMLGLKPFSNPYNSVFADDENIDSWFRIFFNSYFKDKLWLNYPKFHSDWDWIHKAAEFVYSKLEPSDPRRFDLVSRIGRNDKERAFLIISGIAKQYNKENETNNKQNNSQTKG